MIGKKDIVLIVVVLFIALGGYLGLRFMQLDGKEVVVTVDGKEVLRTDISKNQKYTVPESNGKNIVQIKDNEVIMSKADCPDQICVNHAPISKSGETIVCLPHKVVVEVMAQEDDNDIDGITR